MWQVLPFARVTLSFNFRGSPRSTKIEPGRKSVNNLWSLPDFTLQRTTVEKSRSKLYFGFSIPAECAVHPEKRSPGNRTFSRGNRETVSVGSSPPRSTPSSSFSFFAYDTLKRGCLRFCTIGRALMIARDDPSESSSGCSHESSAS